MAKEYIPDIPELSLESQEQVAKWLKTDFQFAKGDSIRQAELVDKAIRAGLPRDKVEAVLEDVYNDSIQEI